MSARELASGLRTWMRRLASDVCERGRRSPDAEGDCRADCESVSLAELRPGAGGTVSCLEEPASRPSRKLASMGLLPGVPLELLQDRPVYVVRVRHTRYALDTELAGRVRVMPDGHATS